MRRHQQQQILELLETLKEAQSESLYADCQEGALFIGEFIESIAGEDTQTVALLEEYCELVFKASNGELGKKALHKQMLLIENSVKRELKPDRKEIVFLSYKASMSDSIESIYLAAKADPDCDEYWIPIPYFEKNPDGSLGEMHYEGPECYSNDITCTNWQEYDIEARHPDVIITFNPYDSGNIVTSVHADFYCEKLRDMTDCLVYVPYFVAVGDVREVFCKVAGCKYAHKVIVESEKVRKTYIRVFKEAFGNKFGRPEDKFFALGSPKYDKVINTKREDCSLPNKWREIIGDKKVVLYNTSIGAMLDGDELYLQKMRLVLDKYRKSNDTVLWWRPHPLIASTYRSMRPNLLAEYEQIVSNFKEGNWGIFDETEDIHRAIAWTDEYYGDWSSLVSMYAVTNKPVMIQRVDVSLENSRQDWLMFECSYDDGEFVWFAAYFHNALYKLDKQTWVAEYIGAFPDEPDYAWKLYTDVAHCDGKLYFAPYAAARIAIYDMSTGLFSAIDLKEPAKERFPDYNENYKFSNAVRNGGYVYFIPGMYPAIVMLDTQCGEIKYITDWLEPLHEIKNENLWYFFGATVVDTRVYVTAFCADALLVIDGMSCELKPIGNGECVYNGICYDGSDFWLVPHETLQGLPALIKWNEHTGQTTVVHLGSESDCAETGNSAAIVWGVMNLEGYVWVIPNRLRYSLKINAPTGDRKCFKAFQAECNVAAKPAIYHTFVKPWEKDGVLFALGARSGAISRYDFASGDSSIETITEECHARLAKDSNNANLGTAGSAIYRAIM